MAGVSITQKEMKAFEALGPIERAVLLRIYDYTQAAVGRTTIPYAVNGNRYQNSPIYCQTYWMWDTKSKSLQAARPNQPGLRGVFMDLIDLGYLAGDHPAAASRMPLGATYYIKLTYAGETAAKWLLTKEVAQEPTEFSRFAFIQLE